MTGIRWMVISSLVLTSPSGFNHDIPGKDYHIDSPGCSFRASVMAQQEDTLKIRPAYREVNDYVDDNEYCLRCHGEMKYTLEDEFGRIVTNSICPDKLVNRALYYTGVHKSFACTDCHSSEFNTFPHPFDARMEEKLLCMDCHGYDESFAKYHFEEAEMEFAESIHKMDEFTLLEMS